MVPCGSEPEPASLLSSSSSGSDARVSCKEPGSLTGQKAEPVGMKFTLFLSGQEKRGADVDCLELHKNMFSGIKGGSRVLRKFSISIKASIPHFLKSFNLLTALWWFPLEHIAVVGFG